MTPFRVANARYERWLRTKIRVVAADLAHKHDRMAESPFVFLRASFFRWAGTIEALCPDLADSPPVLGVGDCHIENFGSWRDCQGRLVWGVNDFDEAAAIPYAFDLVRLAASARLAPGRTLSGAEIARVLLRGYGEGLDAPKARIVDGGWLDTLLQPTQAQRAKFWAEIAASPPLARPASAVRALLAATLPKDARPVAYGHRVAGVGSLGRPRYIAVADWRGGQLVREAKAQVPSAWGWAHGVPTSADGYDRMAGAPWRAVDPFLVQMHGFVVRRLAPDIRKAELGVSAGVALASRLLRAMGREIGSIHAGPHAAAIRRDLAARPRRWLRDSSARAADAVTADYEDWRKG